MTIGKRAPRITHEVEKDVVQFIERAALSGQKVTWQLIAKYSHFTRAALSANSSIKKAYMSANETSSSIRSDSEKNAELLVENKNLHNQVTKLKTLVEELDKKYARMLINAEDLGVDIDKLTAEVGPTLKANKRTKNSK